MTFDPRTEANLATLLPPAQAAARLFMAAACKTMWDDYGVTVKIIAGTRTYAEQDALYAQGRTKPGKIVTYAAAGCSNHNFGVAWDIGLFNGPEYMEESSLYRVCGQIGKAQGLEWGGDWHTIQDEPHFQLATGLTLAQMRARVARGEPVVV